MVQEFKKAIFWCYRCENMFKDAFAYLIERKTYCKSCEQVKIIKT